MSFEGSVLYSERSNGEWVRDCSFTGTCLDICGKKKILGEKEEIMNLGGRGSVETYI